jgi:methionyl-tRNA formyltransferase
MRIAVHGQEQFGKAVLEALLARGENVVAVFSAPDKPGRPPDPLAQFALEKGLPLHQPRSWKTPEALALMTSVQADVCLMAYVTLIVPTAVLNAPRLGTFQYHPSLLPLHRGPSAISWPIAMGRTETGLSIFWPDEGLDEGPILMQKRVAIGPDETLGDVYFKKLFPLGVDAMMESLDLVKAGAAPRTPQDHSQATYESWFKKDLARIDWRKPAADVYNLIRGTNPAPAAWTVLKGQTVDVFDCSRSTDEGLPGRILRIDADGVQVGAGGGSVLVKRVRPAGGQKVAASEWAAAAGLVVGDGFDVPA